MAGLTFVNQVGAVEGMNQAAPGTLIPDTFVRWSQDVLFDRAGLIRRRGPFTKFDLYKTDAATSLPVVTEFTAADSTSEVILGVLSTYDPIGNERIGMLIRKTAGSTFSNILRVFDKNFTFLGEQLLPFTADSLTILTAKPALGGGLWVSLSSDPSDSESQYQFFWRGGYNNGNNLITRASCVFEVDASGVTGFDPEHSSYTTSVTVPSGSGGTTGLSVGQFVFASVVVGGVTKYRYIGVVSNIPDATHITLEKRPYMWSDVIDNNHSVTYNIVSSAGTGSSPNYVTFRIDGPNKVLFTTGDFITVASHSVSAYNTDHEITSVVETLSGATINYTTITTKTIRVSDGSGGTMRMKNDIQSTSLTQNLVFTSVRPHIHIHGRGLLNTTTDSVALTSGTAGTSGEGHWKSAAVTNWNVYRASDNAYYGKVKEITNNTTGNFWADPGINTTGDEYIMKPITDIKLTDAITNDYMVNNRTSDTFAGLYTAVYAGYQWYGNFSKDDQNTNRVVFSAAHDREAVDLSRDAADSIVFPGKSQFRGLGSSSAGLLVFLEDRTYILRGNDRTNFSVEQLVPEGCLCPSSIVEYGGGVFWAGKSGIMYFDGASVRNLTKDNLGLYYTDSLDVFNPIQDRVIGFIHKNNLIMHYTAWKSPFDPIRYEPIYVSDWESNPAYVGRSFNELDPAFTSDDLNSEANVPIYWDQKKLNNPEESASIGTTITWGADGAATAKWGDVSSINKYGPLRKNTSMTFAIYLPTNALTTISNMDPRGVASTETLYGIKTIVGVNSVEDHITFKVTNKALTSNTATLTLSGGNTFSIGKSIVVDIGDPIFDGTFTVTGVTSTTVSYAKTHANVTSTSVTSGTATEVFNDNLRARFIDIHPVFDTSTNGPDDLLVEKLNIPYSDLVLGPDFYIQTKHFTVGDPILRKWFQRVMISMLLYDGAMRMDLVDDDDNDSVDISKKKHQYWELFTETGYNWDYLGRGDVPEDNPSGQVQFGVVFPKLTSPAKSTWNNVQATQTFWDELFTSDFNRYAKRFSWRYPSVGFRLYQVNNYKKPFNGVVTTPTRVEVQGFSIGFKALRQGRV